MSIQERVATDYATLLSHPAIQTVELVRQVVNRLDGYLRVRCTLINGDFLEVALHVVLQDEQVCLDDYRYQWMNGDRSALRRRWDNSPHFPDLPDFPHHCHVEHEDKVEPAEALNLETLLEFIANHIAENNGEPL
jgi:Family of unknown function (DUF6516)